MKTKPIFLLLLCLVALTFYACPKPEPETPCTMPVREYSFPKNASKWLFAGLKPGDTIKFNVYHRDNRASNYIYRRQEIFMVKDTMVKKFEMGNAHYQPVINCNDSVINDYLVADITGPEQLTCLLTNDSYTQLNIAIQGMSFDAADFQYTARASGYYDDSVAIGGKEYYGVNLCKGGPTGTYNYIDSTYMFINFQQGMLKFIINDTLIYQRILH